jgi:hypothetical protein
VPSTTGDPEEGARWRQRMLAPRKLCPRCLGPLREVGTLSGWLVPPSYACAKCGYAGAIAVENANG